MQTRRDLLGGAGVTGQQICRIRVWIRQRDVTHRKQST